MAELLGARICRAAMRKTHHGRIREQEVNSESGWGEPQKIPCRTSVLWSLKEKLHLFFLLLLLHVF